jgi:hypothetical protein
LPDAWRRTGIRRAQRKQERAQARVFYEGSNRRAEAVAGIITGFSEVSAKYSVTLISLSPLPRQIGFRIEEAQTLAAHAATLGAISSVNIGPNFVERYASARKERARAQATRPLRNRTGRHPSFAS